ncbi:CDP-alcohol phosphatidyltransferase family protein [Acidocella sp.]|uniref:CDP-alcohol phosphatidyltransferase family protein n=1 Tax=Acidocella sp. TaxID=50710 RepID=UPI003CFE72B1
MSDAASLGAADPVRRTYEIEDPTNLYFIHPLSARLVPVFAKYGVTPNAVSLIGMGCGVLAGVAYHFYNAHWAAVLGFVLMLAWHVMDGADGQLARLTKSYSELGKVLDGVCDYVTFTAVYVGLAMAMSRYMGGWAWALVACAGLAHAVQSAAYEMQRQEYNFLGWGRQSAALPKLDSRPRGVAGRLHHLYARVQLWASGGAAAFQAEFAARLAADPRQDATLRAAYREAFAPVIRRWGVLCANYRTLGLFVAALIKLPALYFVFEIVGFGAILLILLEAQKVHYRAFLGLKTI